MPIHKMNYEDGVFYTQTTGYFDNVDARMWLKAFQNYAAASDSPIIGVIDVRDAERLCSTIPKLLNDVLPHGNILNLVVTMGGSQSRTLDKIVQMNKVKVVFTAEDAHRFAQTNVRPSFGMNSSNAYSMYAVATM